MSWVQSHVTEEDVFEKHLYIANCSCFCLLLKERCQTDDFSKKDDET